MPAKESAPPAAATVGQPSVAVRTEHTAEEEVEKPATPKVIMSKAQRRKLKKPPVVVTAQMKEEAREEKRELRRHLRMLKSNGSRKKVAKLRAKRERDEGVNEEVDHAFDSDYQVLKKGRRLE